MHGHWLMTRAMSLYPDTELADNVTKIFTEQFTGEKIAKEIEYFNTRWGKSFERTYGWAWLLKLQVNHFEYYSHVITRVTITGGASETC